MSEITRYVVTVKVHEQTLTETNELNNHFSRAGFTLTLTDDDGKVHDLGTNTFAIASPQSEDDINNLAAHIAQSAIDRDAEITLMTFSRWLENHRVG